MVPQAPDHGLVLGALALRLGLVSRDQLGEVLRDWIANPSVSAGQLLLERGYLSKSDQARLEATLASSLAVDKPAADGHERDRDDGGEPTLPSLRTLVSPTIGSDEDQLHSDAARTLGQTFREPDARNGRSLKSIVLSELNASHQRFKLLRAHAKGGLGVVSVAHDVELDREVAVKEMRLESHSDDAVQRFLMEAKVTGQLDHPGIPPVYALGYFEDGRPFYVMRLIEGVTLKQAAEDFHKRYPPPDTSRQRSLELRKLLGAFVSVCHTLRYAHSRHVLHRDIKPSNIMLGNFGETLVLDWGLAKCREESLPYSELEAKAHQSKRRYDDPTLTGTGSVLGTPHYMSPEQARGQWESVNLRSEVYSLGATLYTILTGKLPFSGTTRDAVLEQVRQGNCRPPKEVDARIPAELDAICMRAMALQREDRFATAGELASEIEHWLADEPVSSYRENAGRRWQRWWKTHQTALGMLLALVATGLLAVLVGAFAVSFEHRRANELWQRAETESKRAERNAEAARHFVGRFLTLNYNRRLSQLPDSEGTRLALLNEVVDQLKQWALEEPENLELKLDVAEAIRERSYLHAAMNEPDKAWSDMTRALDIVEDMVGAPDTPLHERLLLTRLYALNDFAVLVEQKYGPAATLDLLMPAQREADQLLQQDTEKIGRRVALSGLNMTIARQLHHLGRQAEAAEWIDRVASQFEVMLATSNQQTLEQGLYDGPETIRLLTCEARQLQARIMFALGDYAFATVCLERAERLCDTLLDESPSAYVLLVIKLDLLALRSEMSAALDPPAQALRVVRHATEQSLQIVSRFPFNREIRLAAATAELRHATQELRAGSSDRATTAASYAVDVLETLCGEPNAQPLWLYDLAHAYRVRAETALAMADGEAAAALCYQARCTLVAAATTADASDGLAAESVQIELVEAQAEMLH